MSGEFAYSLSIKTSGCRNLPVPESRVFDGPTLISEVDVR